MRLRLTFDEITAHPWESYSIDKWLEFRSFWLLWHFLWQKFGTFDFISYICSIARTCESKRPMAERPQERVSGRSYIWERRFRTFRAANANMLAWLAESWEKSAQAERLSLCITNFANSSIPQQTDDNETSAFGTFLYTYIYIVRAGVGFLRCLSCVGRAMRRPVMPGWAKKQTPTPFLYHKLNLKQYV